MRLSEIMKKKTEEENKNTEQKKEELISDIPKEVISKSEPVFDGTKKTDEKTSQNLFSGKIAFNKLENTDFRDEKKGNFNDNLSNKKNIPEKIIETSKSSEIENIYNDAIVFIKLLFSHITQIKTIGYTEISNIINNFIKVIEMDNNKITSLTLEETPKNYLIGHSVNVCILALKIAHSYGIIKETLFNIGLSALLHDLGMAKYSELIYQKDKLSDEDMKNLKTHSKESCEIIDNFTDIPLERKKIIKDIIYSIHERKTGKGYPTGDKNVLIESQIIGIVNIFESMTHHRLFREKLPPYKAIECILKEEQKSFDPKIFKVLIEELSVYPVGSIVRLDNNLIAEVIATNKSYPLRPVVQVIFNNIDINATNLDDLRLIKGTVIDLSKNSMFYIKEGVENWKEQLKEKEEKKK